MRSELVKTNEQPEEEVSDECDLVVFRSEDEMNNSLKCLCHGDLYIIGRIWIETLKKFLVGAKMTLIPVVSAAKAPEPPQKPPPMKYTDLPLYRCPHNEYKTYIEDKKKCPKYKVKILHQYLLPKVRCWRKDFERRSCEAKCTVLNTYCNLSRCVNNTKKDFKNKMRDPDNLTVRQALVLVGGATGFLLGSGKSIPKRLFLTGIGLLSTGALCFPKETDTAFREFTYYSSKALIAAYNGMCGKQFGLRERMPCKEDLPPPTLPRKSQCPPKK